MTDAADAPALEALPPATIADLLAASSATIVAELEALGVARRLAPGAGRVERQRVRRPPHRGRAARVRRPDPDDPGARTDRTSRPTSRRGTRPRSPRRGADHRKPAAELAAEFAALRADGVALVRGLTTGRPRARRHAPARRAAARRRAAGRVGPPRSEPHPPDAGGHPGPGLGPDGQRPSVQPRGPLTGVRPGRAADRSGSGRGRRLLGAAIDAAPDAPADDAAEDRADEVDPDPASGRRRRRPSRSSAPG